MRRIKKMPHFIGEAFQENLMDFAISVIALIPFDFSPKRET